MFFTTGKFQSTFAHFRRIALGQTLNELADLGTFCRLPHFFFCGADPAISDVVGNCVVEQHSVLRNHANRSAQALLLHIAQILTINCYRTGLNIVKTEQKARDGRLPGTGRANDGYRFTCGNIKADISQNRPISIIEKINIVEADGSALNDQLFCVVFVNDFRWHAQQIEHAFDVGQTLSDLAVHKSDEVQRDRQLHEEHVDQHKVAQRLLTALHGQSGHNHADQHADAEDQLLSKVQPAKGCPSFGGCLFILRHGNIEAIRLHFLIAEIFDCFEIQQRVYRLGISIRV